MSLQEYSSTVFTKRYTIITAVADERNPYRSHKKYMKIINFLSPFSQKKCHLLLRTPAIFIHNLGAFQNTLAPTWILVCQIFPQKDFVLKISFFKYPQYSCFVPYLFTLYVFFFLKIFIHFRNCKERRFLVEKI